MPLSLNTFDQRYSVNGGQSLSRDQVVQAGQQVGLSPDEAGYLYDSGVRNNVDATLGWSMTGGATNVFTGMASSVGDVPSSA